MPTRFARPLVQITLLLLILFGRRGPIGGFLADTFGIVFSFRWTGAALACGVMGFPLLVRAIRLSAEAVDARLEEAAGAEVRPAIEIGTARLEQLRSEPAAISGQPIGAGPHGLGLGVIRQLAFAHGGELSVVRSGPDGTTIEVRFRQPAAG